MPRHTEAETVITNEATNEELPQAQAKDQEEAKRAVKADKDSDTDDKMSIETDDPSHKGGVKSGIGSVEPQEQVGVEGDRTSPTKSFSEIISHGYSVAASESTESTHVLPDGSEISSALSSEVVPQSNGDETTRPDNSVKDPDEGAKPTINPSDLKGVARDQQDDSITPQEKVAEEVARAIERAERYTEDARDWREREQELKDIIANFIGPAESPDGKKTYTSEDDVLSDIKDAQMKAEEAQAEAEDVIRAARAAVAEALGEEAPDPRGSPLIKDSEDDVELPPPPEDSIVEEALKKLSQIYDRLEDTPDSFLRKKGGS